MSKTSTTVPPLRAGRAEVSVTTSVETLRGVACLLIVALHVIGFSSSSGMQLGEGTIYREYADLFAPLRVPLFTFLSGFVYAYFPVGPGRLAEFARKKLMRIGLPFFTATTIYFLLTFVAGDVSGRLPVGEFWRIYLFPYVHFWFLQAIALIFAATALLERAGALRMPGGFATTLVAATVASFVVGGVTYESFFSYDNAIYLAPFFLLGLGANRFRDIVISKPAVWICSVVFVVAAVVHTSAVLEIGVDTPTAVRLAVGLSGCLVLFYFTPRIRWLEVIGAYSFTIYLLHPFAIAPSRKILEALDFDLRFPMFLVSFVLGVLCPIVFEIVARHVPVARRWILGRGSGSPMRRVAASAL